MTEVSSAGAAPVIGGGAASNSSIVSGLDGLRQLIEKKQSELRSEGEPYNDAAKSSVESSSGSSTITSDNVILAIVGRHPKAYVRTDDGIQAYTAESFNGNVYKLEAELDKLDDGHFLSMANKSLSGQRMLINRGFARDLTIARGGVIYQDYLIKLNQGALRAAETMLSQAKLDRGQKPDNKSKVTKSGNSETKALKPTAKPSKSDEPAPMAANSSTNSSDELISKVLAVRKLTDGAKGKVTPQDAMRLFLLLGEASKDLLSEIFGTEPDECEAIMDSLRRARGIGEVDAAGKAPILIDDVAELSAGNTPEESMANFRAAVRVEDINETKLVYDLDELARVSIADSYMACLADYVRQTSNQRVRRLFDGGNKRVKVSRLLRVVSSDSRRPDYHDLVLFEQAVTICMMMRPQSVTVNPSAGYPFLQWQVRGTDNLKEDMLRFILTNYDWIDAILSESQKNSLTAQLSKLEFDEPNPARKALRLKLWQICRAPGASSVDEAPIASGQGRLGG